MTVVVTGAAGFIGSHLVEVLAGRGERVIGVDRHPFMPPAAAVRIVADLAVEPQGDVDEALLEAAAVFHLAGRPGVRDDGRAPHELDALRHTDNVLAAQRVLDRTPPQVPLVVTSSSSVYGGAQGGRPCREDDRPRPRGGYARSKLRLERRCRKRAERGGLTAVARPFTVAGEGQRADMAIARWLAAARAGQPLRILGSPAHTRDVTDVRHVVEALVRLADRGVHGTVNLGTGHGHRLGDIATAVCEAVGRPVPVLVEPASAADVPHTLADTRRCHALLGMIPATDLHALVRRQAGAGPGYCQPPMKRPASADATTW